jgi:acyl carrier protein
MEAAARDLSSDIIAEIRRIAVEELELGQPPEPADELIRDLKLDSIALITLAAGLENRFRVKLNEEDAGHVVTVADLAALVLRRAAEAGAR